MVEAGVGGDVDSLVRTAASGRQIVALDGCHLQCVKHCLQRHGIAPALHYTLSELGVRKRYHADFDPADAERVIARVRQDLESREARRSPEEPAAACAAGA